ncbi:MAG: DNA double-strand break repair nuclease NurA [Dehalococcoidia bacterium]|nr:MAG: DNA double-strand break repair nuclease NurA [Dehalococcoidia bacterium]
MSLNLTDIASQIVGMAASLKANSQKRQQQKLKAIAICSDCSTDLEWLKIKALTSKTSWLVAQPVERLDCHRPPPPPPDEFTIIATDGSQIDVDRHLSARCYIINIGSVVLKYGTNPDAILNSLPKLYSDERDLVIVSPDGRGREQLVEGTLLGIKRSVEECKQLATITTGVSAGASTLALMDGTLILWNLVSKEYPEFVIEELLNRGFIRYLDEMKKLNKDRRVSVASYISFPRSTDVVNTLRVAICPHEIPDCDRYCAEIVTGKRECDTVTGIHDRDLFSELLADGERSALFTSQSSIVEKCYGNHRIHFFYLRVDDEIARIEIPKWVEADKNLLNMTHSLILDQCRRGHGYPVALSEAHQQAVVSGADRENFQRLIEMALVEENIQLTASAKSLSKKTRWI